MTRRAFDKIAAGLDDAIAITEGRADPSTYRAHVPASVDVAGIRKRLGLSQAAFAARFGLSVGTVRDWEQGRTTPEPVARVLLTVIATNPRAVEQALASA